MSPRIRTLLTMLLVVPCLGPTRGIAGTTATPSAAEIAGRVDANTPHFDLETLYSAQQYVEGRALALERVQDAPTDVDALLHLLRFSFEIAEPVTTDNSELDKTLWYAQMVEWSEEAVRLAPHNPRAAFARAVSKARLGTTQGILSSLVMLADIESDWIRAANNPTPYATLKSEEIQPCDTYMVLGAMYRMVPEWWIIEAMTGTRGDLDKSLFWLRRADVCSPNRIETIKELAAAELCYGLTHDRPDLVELGKARLGSLSTLQPTKATQVTDKRHGQMLLEAPSLACAYSRDGQADLDRSLVHWPSPNQP